MSNEELIAQAQAWGFRCEMTSDGKWGIFPGEEKENHWRIIWDGQYWVMFSQEHASLNFHPEDALQFLKQRCQR